VIVNTLVDINISSYSGSFFLAFNALFNALSWLRISSIPGKNTKTAPRLDGFKANNKISYHIISNKITKS